MPTHTALFPGLRRRLRSLRRAVLARRRLLAALLAAAAVLVGLRAVAAPPPPTTGVLVAARDLPAGTTLTPGDLREARYAEGTAPSGLATEAPGRVLAAPVSSGEPITAVRLLGEPLAAAHDGLAVLPVRLGDEAAAGLLRAGDRIDLLATDPATGDTRRVASDVVVVTPAPDEAQISGVSGRLVVIGVTQHLTESVTSASVSQFLTYAYGS